MIKDTVLIIGARSDIAISVAHRFAKEGYDIQLAARNISSLDADKSDIKLRYQVEVSMYDFDALDIGTHENFVNLLPQLPAIAVCAVGYMGVQAENERNLLAAVNVIRSNFEGPASIFAVLANHFEKRGSGTLVGISSVAGERGRAKNYVYGSAKAGFTTFLSGLRNRLAKKGVHVITVLPGFVTTKMTKDMDLPSKLTAQPDEVATAVFNAVKKKHNIIYVKKIWMLVIKVIRSIPEIFFKRMKL
jgi:decaprenylphospho-beta-D-erythro-pentofuranosid-2-ulose 2-reductase